MQTISLCCGDMPLWRVLLQVQAMMWAQRKPSGRKKFCDGVVNIYLHLLRTSHGDDFSYASPEGMAKKFGVHIRTIERWLNLLIEEGFISKGKKFVGCWRRGFFLNAHKLVVALFSRIEGLVTRLHGGENEDDEELSAGKKAPESGCEKRQVVGKLPPQLTIRNGVNEKDIPPCPPQTGDAAGAAKEREDADATDAAGDVAPAAENPTWQAALALLLQRLPEAEVKLWLAPIRAMESETGLRLDCPDRYAMAHIEGRFGQAIGEALRQVGVEHFIFSFGVQQMELQREEERQEWDKAAAEEKRRLEVLASRSWEDQFAVLASIYPRKTCGVWLAKKLFRRLHKRGELPEIGVLLKLVKEQAASEDWQRDRGRWIPGLYKWLQNRPWWNLGNEKQETQSWLCPS